MNIFEQATRSKTRFQTERGQLTVEDLWTLPLTSIRGPSLNGIGMVIQKQIRETDGDSLVETAKTDTANALHLQLDIIKHIIAVKQGESRAATEAKGRAVEAERIKEILAKKGDEALQGLSEEQLRERLKALQS